MAESIDYTRFARLYDTVVRFEEDIPFFRRLGQATPGRVLELMSGTGRVSIPLLRSRVELTCLDLSASMLAILEGKLAAAGLGVRVVRADVRDLPFPDASYPLAILPFNSFSELVTEDGQRRALGSIHRVLAPGGRFVCTLHNPQIRLRGVTPELTTFIRQPRSDPPGDVVLRMRSSFDPRTRVVTGVEIIEELDGEGRSLAEISIPIRFALPTRASFEAMAGEAGFEVEAFYGDYREASFEPSSSPFMIWLLQKL